jgi:hypothetical protein
LAIIKYREKLQTVTGPISFAERFFGSGGTFTLLALVGSIGIIVSILVLFNVHTVFIESIVTKLF